MKNIYLSIFLFLLVNFSVIAQNQIRGRITDENNNPLAGTNIYAPELNKGTVSDENGEYALKNLPDGKIKIQFSYLGYNSIVNTFFLNGIEVELNVILKQTPIEAEEIVVSGGYHSTQHENAVKIDVLKLNRPSNKLSPNLSEIIAKIPGVDMISKGSGVSKPVIRGLSMDNVVVLNNGVRNENYQYSDHHPLGINEFGVDDVEIIKGPASLLYGSDAIGGVVNFIREKPAPTGEIKGDYTMQLFSNTLGINNNLGLKATARNFFGGIRIGSKNHSDFLQGGGDFAANSRFNEYSLKANCGYTSDKGLFKLYYDLNDQKLGLTEDEAIDAITSRGRINKIWYQQFNNHLLSSQNKLFFNDYKLEVNAAFQSNELRHYAGIDTVEIAMTLSTLTYETKLYLPSDEKSEYIIGFQGSDQTNRNSINSEVILLPYAHTNSYGVFSLAQHTFFKKVKLQAGLRYDYKSVSTDDAGLPGDFSYRKAINKSFGSLSGSFGGTCNFTEKLLFRINFATGYRTPNLAELTSNGKHELRYEMGNAALIPQNTYETDVSMHYHASNFTFDLAGFYNSIDHYIYIAPTSDSTLTGERIFRYMQTNATLYGMEAGIHIHPKHMDWLHAETTFSSVKGIQQNGDYLPFIPANKFTVELKFEKEKLAFMQNAYFEINTLTAFDQNIPAPDEESTPGYSLVDIGLGGSLKINNQHVSLRLSVDNVFDKKYIDHLSTLKEVNFYEPGRNIAFGLIIPFNMSFKSED